MSEDLEGRICGTCKYVISDTPQTYPEKRVYGKKKVLRCKSSDSKYKDSIVQPKEHCEYHGWSDKD